MCMFVFLQGPPGQPGFPGNPGLPVRSISPASHVAINSRWTSHWSWEKMILKEPSGLKFCYNYSNCLFPAFLLSGHQRQRRPTRHPRYPRMQWDQSKLIKRNGSNQIKYIDLDFSHWPHWRTAHCIWRCSACVSGRAGQGRLCRFSRPSRTTSKTKSYTTTSHWAACCANTISDASSDVFKWQDVKEKCHWRSCSTYSWSSVSLFQGLPGLPGVKVSIMSEDLISYDAKMSWMWL